jgi:hypothetical protein
MTRAIHTQTGALYRGRPTRTHGWPHSYSKPTDSPDPDEGLPAAVAQTTAASSPTAPPLWCAAGAGGAGRPRSPWVRHATACAPSARTVSFHATVNLRGTQVAPPHTHTQQPRQGHPGRRSLSSATPRRNQQIPTAGGHGPGTRQDTHVRRPTPCVGMPPPPPRKKNPTHLEGSFRYATQLACIVRPYRSSSVWSHSLTNSRATSTRFTAT